MVLAGDDAVRILWGDAEKFFVPGKPLNVGTNPHGIAIGDFNGDGILDMAVGSRTSMDVWIYIGTQKGSFRSGAKIRVPDDVISLRAGDMNGDGKLDLVLAFVSLNRIWMYLGDGKGRFSGRGLTASRRKQ